MQNEGINHQIGVPKPNIQKHYLEEIDEESIPDDEPAADLAQRKNGHSPDSNPEVQNIEDNKSIIEEITQLPSISGEKEKKDDKLKISRHLSVSNGEIGEAHRLEALEESDKSVGAQPRYTRHMSIDQKYGGNPLKQNAGNDDAIERYYERNNYTVTGRDRADFFNKLPPHMQHRINPGMNIDAQSRLSTPGALGEPVVPVTRRFNKSIYFFAFNRKKIGLRHICIILLVLLYTLLGAAMFYSIESRFEREKALTHAKKLEVLLHELAENITENVNNPNTSTTTDEMRIYIREAYIDLMKLEDQYKGSTYYKLSDPENNWKWTFESAFFFSMNVYTTTGYGSIAPESALGQFLVCLYGFIFVPVTLVALRDLGQFCLVYLTKFYAHAIQKYRDLTGNNKVDEDEMIQIPIFVCLGILTAYLASCTVFIHFYDDLSGDEPNTGISMFLSFYFSFVSLSTIGLGDVMPNNATFSPLISIIFFFGMCVTKVVNRTTYIAFENGIFGSFTMLENWLDSLIAKPTVEPPKVQRSLSMDAQSIAEEAAQNDLLNNFTVRSLATFMKSNADIYGGGFGRVQLRRGDIMGENQSTVNSMSQVRQRTTSSQKEP